MKNLAELCLLAALVAVPSLAADLSPHPPSKADSQSMGGLNFESLHPGIIPATEVSGLGKRQNTCASSDSYPCASGTGCCPLGTTCDGDGVKEWCCPTGEICNGSISYCPAGETDCANIIGVSGCCPTATHRCAISGGTPGCARLGTSGGSSGSDLCDPGTYICADGSGCCPNGTTCVTGASLCRKQCEVGWTECSFGGCCDPGYTCDSTTELCRKSGGVSGKPSTTPKPTRSSSTAPLSTKPTVIPSTTPDDPFTSISTRPTTTIASSEPTIASSEPTIASSEPTIASSEPTIASSEPTIASSGPTSPPKSENENPSNNVGSLGAGTGSRTTSSSSTSTAPSNGGNALKPGAWLGGFGIAFFFVFFHL